MMNRFKEDLYIICESTTEIKFINKLKENFVCKYNLILINAKGKPRISKEYLKVKRRNNYSKVFVMYDLDNIDTLETIIKSYSDIGIKISKKDIYYINPDFEMLLILCKENRLVINNYNIYIKKHFNIDNYKKSEKELEKIFNLITREDLINLNNKMKKLIVKNDKENRSSNYYDLFNKLFIIK